MKAIMYHYIRKSSKKLPYFRYLHVDNFKKQLDYFESKYKFIEKEEFLETIRLGKTIKKKSKSIVLTFDDGFSDHYKYVFPELKKRNLWGLFYIPTGIYEEKILDVHRIHHLLGSQEANKLLVFLKNIISSEMLTNTHNKEFKNLTYKTQDHDSSTKMFKQILNYFISYNWRKKIIDQLMEEFYDEKLLHKELYMKKQQLKKMNKHGMMIGSHSVNHFLLSKLSSAEQKKEIINSFTHLRNILEHTPVKTFCYPYGESYSFTKETEHILTKEKCLFTFNVEERDITTNDIKKRPQALPRHDCNSFPHGKASLG